MMHCIELKHVKKNDTQLSWFFFFLGIQLSLYTFSIVHLQVVLEVNWSF